MTLGIGFEPRERIPGNAFLELRLEPAPDGNYSFEIQPEVFSYLEGLPEWTEGAPAAADRGRAPTRLASRPRGERSRATAGASAALTASQSTLR
jgi:hypothetical protein